MVKFEITYCTSTLLTRAQWECQNENFETGHLFSIVKLNFNVGLFSCIFWFEAIFIARFALEVFTFYKRGKNMQNWQNCEKKTFFEGQKRFPRCLNGDFGGLFVLKSGLRILIWPLEVPFFWVRKRPLLPKVPIFETKKMALRVAKSKF